MKLEGAEAISQLQELENLVKYQVQPSDGRPELVKAGAREELISDNGLV